MKSIAEKRIKQLFPEYNVQVEEFGIGSNDHGNEYYLTVCFTMVDTDISVYEGKGYEGHQHYIEECLNIMLDEPAFDQGDYASTLECVCYGNDTMIALITICK